MKTQLDSYASVMRNIRAPKQVHDNTAQVIEDARREAMSDKKGFREAQRISGADAVEPRVRKRHDRLPMRFKVAAMTGAIVLCMGGAYTLDMFQSHDIQHGGEGSFGGLGNTSSTTDSSEEIESESLKQDDVPEGNFFTLVAYADEGPQGELLPPDIGRPISLSVDDFFGTLNAFSASTTYDHETGITYSESERKRFASGTYGINLQCTGIGIESVTYTIEGDRVYFQKSNNVPASSEDRLNIETVDSFTVDFDEQDDAETQTSILLSYPLSQEQLELSERLMASSQAAEVSAEEVDALHSELMADAKKTLRTMLTDARIVVDVMYEDGTSETKTYAITVDEPFEQKEAEWHALTDAWYAEVDKAYAEGREVPERPRSPYSLVQIA